MTDQQIEDAYRRMDSGLAPPLTDVVARVERRIRVRRSRRRVAVGGVAGLMVAGTVTGALLLGGGDNQDGDSTATDPTHPAGSPRAHPTGRVDVQDVRPDPHLRPAPVPRRAGAGAGLAADLALQPPGHDHGRVLNHPFAYFEASVPKVDGRTFQLPVGDDNDPDERTFTLFAADQDAAPTSTPAGFSSAEKGAAGTVVVKRASCDPTPVLELEVDTTLGSEVQKGTVDLTGSFAEGLWKSGCGGLALCQRGRVSDAALGGQPCTTPIPTPTPTTARVDPARPADPPRAGGRPAGRGLERAGDRHPLAGARRAVRPGAAPARAGARGADP